MTLFYLPLLGGFSDEKKKRRNEGEQGQGGTPGKVKCEPLAWHVGTSQVCPDLIHGLFA
jgi:hypothetical protein